VTTVNVNLKSCVDFLVGLLNTPSPTGYTIEAIEYTRKAFDALAFPNTTLTVTRKGALLISIKGRVSNAPIGLTAHVDTLGLMVKEIKGSGRLKTTQIGGFMWGAVEFEGVTVRTSDNRRYRGTILPQNPSVHVNADIKDAKRTQDSMEVRIDALTRSAAETRALGIEVGDFVFLDPRVEVTDTGFIRSRHLDDKLSVACVYGALLGLKEAEVSPVQDTYILISNYEEVGHGGSAGFPVELAELVAIDMAAIGDGQNSDEYSCTLCVKDATGPYHFELGNKLRRIATAHNIKLKTDIYMFYGSDGSAYWRAGGAGRVALVGHGVDASHAYERTHTDSIVDTVKLLASYMVDAEV
jgi:putative aminopeptidase FrvX